MMTSHDIATIISHRIADHAEQEARSQRSQARCHEHAMTLTPGTPDRNTVDGLVAASLNNKQKARAVYMALIDVARSTRLLTEDQIQAAMKQGKAQAAA